MKILIETTGSFMLVDPYTGEEINPHRPHVVTHTSFIDQRIASRQLHVVNADLTDEATDAEFAEFWAESKGDAPLAIASFVSKFSSQDPEPAPKKRQSKKEEAPNDEG